MDCINSYLENGGSAIETGDRELRDGQTTQQVKELAEQG